MEALARFVALAVSDGAPPPPYALRRHLMRTFPPGEDFANRRIDALLAGEEKWPR